MQFHRTTRPRVDDPRKRSGSSAEKQYAVDPFGHVSRRLDGSYSGRFPGGLMARIPLSPSTMTSRASAAVGPMSASLPAHVRLFANPTPRLLWFFRIRGPPVAASIASRQRVEVGSDAPKIRASRT